MQLRITESEWTVASDALIPGIFVGVDSGGTRTNVQIWEWEGSVAPPKVTSYEVSETLSGALREEQIPETIRSILAPLEMRVHEPPFDSLPIHLWVSAAGFAQWSREKYVNALEDLTGDLLGDRVKCVGIANDAVSLLLGSRADGVIIAGTGSNVLIRQNELAFYQSGGHEWVACDYGSGFWIGLRAIRAAYRDLEDGTRSVLLQRMRELYGVRPGDDGELIRRLRDLGVGDENVKKEVARFAADVCHASERGDEDAQNIVKSEAEELADVTAGALRRSVARERLESGLRMVQCGSLIGNPFYRSSFEAQLEMRLLTGSENGVKFDWQRVITGSEAAVRLAQDLLVDPDQYLGIDRDFRPAVFRR
jgi:N-acetylglucosamine kinase-like BadF-type ATPase